MEDVSTVLGLVGRDLLFDLIEAVVDEDGPRAFALADRAVESGHDLKLVCRDLARVVRDIMILSVDPSRAGDGELAEGELERLKQLSGRFSREDLLRAFDVLAKRRAGHAGRRAPALSLRDGAAAVDARAQAGAAGRRAGAVRRGGGAAAAAPADARPHARRRAPPSPAARRRPRTSRPACAAPRRGAARAPARARAAPAAGDRRAAPAGAERARPVSRTRCWPRSAPAKSFFYNTVVAQAQSIDVSGDRVAFTFLPTHRTLREQFEQTRPWIEAAAAAHRRPQGDGACPAGGAAAPPRRAGAGRGAGDAGAGRRPTASRI